MTKKDFFIIAVKLFGLYSLITSLFSILPSNIFFAVHEEDLFGMLWVILVIIIVFGLFVLLIFKSNKIVQSLKLDKGFDDERIDFGNFKTSDLIKIGTFIIGGLLLLENIPVFLSHILFAFKKDIIGQGYNARDKFNWAVSIINLIIGYLLLTNYDFVAALFTNRRTE